MYSGPERDRVHRGVGQVQFPGVANRRAQPGEPVGVLRKLPDVQRHQVPVLDPVAGPASHSA